ncbi:MAG: MFS transporter [Burkholderiales bacterium]|nr:MFS transporter [Burkholderiales bacterium]
MHERWRALWVLSAARVAMGFQFQVIGATAPLLRDAYGFALADIGWLVGLFLAPGVVLALPGGMLSARWGDRRIAVAGTAAMVAGGALSAFATDATMLQAGRLIGGIGGVLFNVTASKMIADWFAGREIELAMSLFVSTWPVGIGLGLLTLGPIAAWGTPAAAFGATAVLALVSMLLVLALYRPAPGAPAPGPLRLSALAPGDGWRLALAAGGWTTYNVAFAVLVAFLPALFVARGLDVAHAGALTATMTLTFVVSIPLGGWLIERTGRPATIAALGILGWAACIAAVRGGGDPTLSLTLAGLLSGWAAGALSAAPARFLGPAARAIGLGLFYSMYYLGMGVLPRLVGAWADRAGTPEVVLDASMALSIATIVLLLATSRAIRRTAR